MSNIEDVQILLNVFYVYTFKYSNILYIGFSVYKKNSKESWIVIMPRTAVNFITETGAKIEQLLNKNMLLKKLFLLLSVWGAIQIESV